MTLKDFCKKYGLTIEQATGKEEIKCGYLDLSSVTSIPEGFNPTVGGSLPKEWEPIHRQGSRHSNTIYLAQQRLHQGRWHLPKIISERGNVMRVQRIAHKEVEYLVTDGEGRWAHGATLKEAKESLIYKITSRDTSKYNDWTLDTTITHAEAIEAYRVITGACAMGTRHFCETILGDKKKEKYTVAEVIELTKGQYGAESFKEFFKK